MSPDAVDLLRRVVADLEDHADGNVGDGCWALHDRYEEELRAVEGTQGTLTQDAVPEEPAPGVGPIPYITLVINQPRGPVSVARQFATDTAPTGQLRTDHRQAASSGVVVVNTGTYLRKEDLLAYLAKCRDGILTGLGPDTPARPSLEAMVENLRRMT